MPEDFSTLKTAIRDWTDVDVAQYSLAVALGLMSPTTPFQTDAKHVFWTDNPTGTMLHLILEDLVKFGVLESRLGSDLQYRWNVAFKGSWE